MRYFLNIIVRILLFTFVAINLVYAEEPAKFNFLALSDIHFDPFITCKKQPCPLIQKLRTAPAQQWAAVLAEQGAPLSTLMEDTNYPLLTNALVATGKISEENHAAFVILPGDLLGHEFHHKYKYFSGDKTLSQYSTFVRKTLQFLTQQLKAAFPATDVYMVVGNNDSYSGNYSVKPDGQFFHDTGITWSNLIHDRNNKLSMQKQFSSAGYYSVLLPNPANLRLIVLNTVLFSNGLKGKNVDTLDAVAVRELNWLHAQLQLSQQQHQKVFIVMHIPQSLDVYATQQTKLFTLVHLWKSAYSERFVAEINQYGATIGGILAGHLHRNWFQIIAVDNNKIPVIGITSISPVFGNYPGFRFISYFSDPLHLDDIVTYSFPLHGATWEQTATRNEVIARQKC